MPYRQNHLHCILQIPRYHLSTSQSSICPLSAVRALSHSPKSKILPQHLAVDEAEDVVEHVVASSTVGKEVERLGVVHGVLLLVDLISSEIQH